MSWTSSGSSASSSGGSGSTQPASGQGERGSRLEGLPLLRKGTISAPQVRPESSRPPDLEEEEEEKEMTRLHDRYAARKRKRHEGFEREPDQAEGSNRHITDGDSKMQAIVIPGSPEMGSMLGYGQNIQFDWNINAAEFKNFYPLTHQGSHAFHKNRRKGKRNLPLADRFVKPSKSASWFVRIFKGAAFLKSDHPLQVSTHEQIINDLLNASSGSSFQNEIRVFFFLSILVGSLFKRQLLLNIYMSHIYIYISLLGF